ncbi:MAG TPA: RNA polymerase sigma factor [Pirellulales bacterium]|jgi:RNA polymerase sigma-70 factor (ECF subfamily)
MAANKQSLAARLARGEESAFAELYDTCADKLHRYLAARLGSTDRAADVLQTTFVRAVQNRRRFAGVENLTGYMFQIARNEAARAGKQSQRQKDGCARSETIEQTIQDRVAVEDAELAAAALAKLDAQDRELIELKIFAGLTFSEIAQVIGQPAPTVATRYRRALESLRPWLERQFR